MQGSRDLIHAISNLFGGVLIVLGAATLGATLIGSREISLLLGGLTLFAGILSFASKVMDALVKLAEAGAEVGSKSLDEAKDEIAGDLKKLKAPILVVLDDVDRLTPQETLEVFQLIKANGDFPNLIYLLLCDRTIVETNISKVLNVSGRDYLEKMVQVPFDVPMIDPERVHQVLFQRLNSILSVEGALKRFSEKRWANVFLSGLRPYFATLRDVNRFISTLAFHFSSFSAGDVFEVNPIDLIALEVIRLREPDVYKALQSSKELLTTAKSDRATADGVTKSVLSIIERGSENHRPELQELIKHLFPTVEWTFEGSRYAEEYGQEWYRDLRVCSAKMFDRYFRLAVSENELSRPTGTGVWQFCRPLLLPRQTGGGFRTRREGICPPIRRDS
jgi:predicted KAP-like P-loop ATPase